MSMGYQVGVTPLQMVAAVSSVANGGDLIQPRVVRALIRDGKRTEVKPTVLGRTISKDTAVTLTGIMEQIVERGTATYAQVDGLHHRGQNRHGGEARQRPLLEHRLLRVVCRIPSVAQSGRDHHRRHRFAARARVLRRPDCRSGLSAHRRGDASALRRAADVECAAAGARRAPQRTAGRFSRRAAGASASIVHGRCERRRARSAGSPRTERARSAACPDEDRIDGAAQRERRRDQSDAGAWNADRAGHGMRALARTHVRVAVASLAMLRAMNALPALARNRRFAASRTTRGR